MRNFIFGVILTSFFSFGMYLYFQNESLISQVNTLKVNTINNNENLQKVKESYYIEQQNRDTNLMLFTVTALIALFSATTFIGVKSEFKTNVAKIEDKYDAQVAEYQKSVVHIKNLEGDLSYEVAKNLANELKKLKDSKDAQMSEYREIVELSLTICDYYSKALFLKSDINKKFKNAVESLLSDELGYTSELLSTQSSFQLEYMGYARFLRIKANIEKIGSKEDLKNLASIFGKLSFPDLD